MRIVPVIDLKEGQVVHARGGARESYRPIRSILAESSEPLELVGGLLALHPFADLYVADLDAIEGQGGHDAVLERLRHAFADLRLWVDKGLASETACRDWLSRGLGDLVIGSESQSDPALVRRLAQEKGGGRIILSLDFRGERFLGPPALLGDVALWPERVIAMTLTRVGGALGPDRERLRSLKARAPESRVYAAGGVRNADDLRDLAGDAVSGALIASALHDGRIGRRDLEALSAAEDAQ